MSVRFAPSPHRRAAHRRRAHGALQLAAGARHDGGTLVLRIEDTDRERSTPENVEQILDALRWLELDWDEGPIIQVAARRRATPRSLQRAARRGHAYRSNATADDVRAFKEQHGAERGFRGEDEGEGARAPARARRGRDGRARRDPRRHALRARAPGRPGDRPRRRHRRSTTSPSRSTTSTRGSRHVVRGEDHLSNTPKQLLVLEALGARAAASTPTCRCCTAPTARSSPSATAPRPCRSCATPATCPRRSATTSRCSAGAPTTTRRSSRPTSSSSASTSTRVSRNPARFDEQKLRWMNGRYLRELSSRRS